MATLPSVGPVGVGAGLPGGGHLEALKYAAQADAFQDDPNFYTWLEDWIGKQDDQETMIDAFHTLTDFGMQFDFQQQQQKMESGAEIPVGVVASASGAADATQHQPMVPSTSAPGGASSCASLASHPSSQPSSDDTSVGVLGSPSDSAFANSSALRPAVALSRNPFDACPAAIRGAAAASDPASGFCSGGGAAAAGPFDAASFTMPMSRGLAAFGLPPELSRLLGRGPDAACSSALGPLSAGAEASLPADHFHSHGTVTSYAGTPPQAAPPSVPPPAPAGQLAGSAAAGSDAAGPGPAPPAPAFAPAAASASVFGGGGGGLQSAGLLGVPSLEQLVARAICGNGNSSGSGASGSAAAGGGDDFGGMGGLGLAVLGGALGPTATTTARIGVGGSAGVSLVASASAPSFARNHSSCSFGDDGAADCVMGSVDEGSPTGSGRLNSQDLPQHLQAAYPQRQALQQQHHLPVRSMSGGGGGGGTTARLLGSRRKSSFSGAHLAAHGHGHGHGHHHQPHYGSIPVSHAHGHAHVGKATGTGAGLGGGGGGGAAHARGSGGVSASGRPTRNARAKAVFAALEAEVAGKLSELEALQQEHATLTQRVEILEVAVDRQDAVLRLMSTAAMRPADDSAAAAAAPSAPSWPSWPGGGGAMAAAGREVLEWARKCTLESLVAWYKDHLQNLSLALLSLEDSAPNPEAEMRLVQLVASCWVRITLVCIFQPLHQLRLKGLNLETNMYAEPSEGHWVEVIKFMTVSPEKVAEMENLFHSYNLLHGSFRAELQDTQAELNQLVAAQDSISRKTCTKSGLEFAMQQIALLKRVRNILQKTHLLYSSTIGVAALRILKPKEFAKCCVQSYPYYPCGPSLMKACVQLRTMHMWGPAAGGCGC